MDAWDNVRHHIVINEDGVMSDDGEKGSMSGLIVLASRQLKMSTSTWKDGEGISVFGQYDNVVTHE